MKIVLIFTTFSIGCCLQKVPYPLGPLSFSQECMGEVAQLCDNFSGPFSFDECSGEEDNIICSKIRSLKDRIISNCGKEIWMNNLEYVDNTDDKLYQSFIVQVMNQCSGILSRSKVESPYQAWFQSLAKILYESITLLIDISSHAQSSSSSEAQSSSLRGISKEQEPLLVQPKNENTVTDPLKPHVEDDLYWMADDEYNDDAYVRLVDFNSDE